MSNKSAGARFRAAIGRSIHLEIRRVQIETAERLLITTGMPIKEVVQRVGVSSVHYFTAMIRHATGQTPGEIRKSALK